MKRILMVAAILLLSAGTASADFVLLKINLNQLNFTPSMQAPNNAAGAMGAYGAAGAMGGAGGAQYPQPGNIGGGRGMMMGGAGGIQPMPYPAPNGMPPGAGAAGFMGGAGAQPPDPKANPYDKYYPEDPSPRWVTALVEINNVSKGLQSTPLGGIVTCDTHWGKNVWVPVFSHTFPMIGAPRIPAEAFATEFGSKFNKEKKEKNIETMLNLARWTLSRGHVKKFHEVMEEAVKLNEKHGVVKQYLRVKKGLDVPFKNLDPAQRELLASLAQNGYKENTSKKGHYTIYAPSFGEDPRAEAAIKRRLTLLEGTLETFYFWFAIQREMGTQPALPTHRLIAVMTGSKEDFISRHADWGSLPRVADGFTPRRDNIIVMSSKPRVDDPNYAELESLITTKLADANGKLQAIGFRTTITRENLLTGEINTHKESGRAGIYIAAAQTAVLLSASLEDQAERHTCSNEGVRQLLVASGAFPRNVQVPDWIVEGMAAFFEVPAGGAYPTVGDRSCVHLIAFKYNRVNNKDFAPADVLQSVISDRYFQQARQLEIELQGRNGEVDRQRVHKAWELARSTSWAFVYYLSQIRKLDYVFNYGKELDKLPRDMDLSSGIMQSCFAKAFDMADPKSPQLIDDYKLKNMAASWFEKMEGSNLDNVHLQTFLEKERAKLDEAPPVIGAVPSPVPGLTPTIPMPNPMPMPMPMPPYPMPMVQPMPQPMQPRPMQPRPMQPRPVRPIR